MIATRKGNGASFNTEGIERTTGKQDAAKHNQHGDSGSKWANQLAHEPG